MIPRVGFGLDAQFSHRYPGGLVGLCERYRHRLSHFSIVSLLNIQSARKFKEQCGKGHPVVHHLPGVAPADVGGPNLDKMKLLNEVSMELDALWVCEDIAIWSVGPYGLPYFTPPIFEQDQAKKIADGINKIQDISDVPFLAEIPSCSLVVGRMPIGDFFHQIVRDTNCRLVADVSHIYSYSIAKKTQLDDTLRSLPLESVWEIHISGGHIDTASKQRYIDTHSEPVPDDIVSLLADAVKLCVNLKCVTYEVGVGLTIAEIDQDLSRLEACLSMNGWSPSLHTFSNRHYS